MFISSRPSICFLDGFTDSVRHQATCPHLRVGFIAPQFMPLRWVSPKDPVAAVLSLAFLSIQSTTVLLPLLIYTWIKSSFSGTSRTISSYHARVGNNTHRVQMRCAQWMKRIIFSWFDLGQDVWLWEKCRCRVCNKLWCDLLCNNVTRVQQARLLASRGCVRFARRPSFHWEKFQKSTHAHMCRSFDSSNPSYSYP